MAAPLSLPEPRDETLERSPLRLVVCQVRHDRIAAIADASRALKVHQAIKDDFPSVEQTVEETLNVAGGPGGIAANRSEPQLGWRFRSSDEKWTITLGHSHFAIETSSYGRWEGFKKRLATLVHAVDEVLTPSLEQRLGLRMVDQVEHPEARTAEGFRGLIVDELLGPLAGGALSPSVRSTQGLIEIEGPDNSTVNLRHGLQPSDTSVSYLLDHDAFRQVGRPFDVNGILDASDHLHQLAKQVFEAVITDKLYKYLQGNTG